jgi:hypothetical protein
LPKACRKEEEVYAGNGRLINQASGEKAPAEWGGAENKNPFKMKGSFPEWKGMIIC